MLLVFPAVLGADQFLFDTAQDWQQWDLPLGAVKLTEGGILQPVQVRKNINAALNARTFGGGIRSAGSNLQNADQVMDGNSRTGWHPDPDDPAANGWIELDLGRAVSAHRVRLVFAEEAPPFEIFDLFLSTGEQARDDAQVPIPGSLVYRIKERFKENERHEVTFTPERPESGLIQFVRLQVLKAAPGAQLVEIEVEGFGNNLVSGMLERGGNVDIIVGVDGEDSDSIPLGNARSLVDGKLSTFWNYRRASRGTNDINAYITLDLGAVYWVDLVRLVSRTATWNNQFFDFKFYEVLTSDGALAPNVTRIWEKQFSGWGTNVNRRQGMADHHFDLTPTRYVRIAWRMWDAACAVAIGGGQSATTRFCAAVGFTEELQVFGKGFPREVRLRSPLLDLNGEKNVTAIRYQADAPAGTRVEIRSRSGNELEVQRTFRDKNGKEVTEKKWGKLIPSFRGPIDSTFVAGPDWSPWSSPYLISGEGFQSPSLRRYVELDVRLVSDTPQAAASLDWLSVEFSNPLAAEVVGEIFPVEVEPGVTREFSYFLKAPLTAAGFDRLAVEASTSLLFVEARLNDEFSEVKAEPNSTGFRVKFPRPVRSSELVELRFEAAVFLQSTRFNLFLEDSRQEENVRQQVEPGDATEQVESSTNIVRLPLSRNLLANLSIHPRLLTPNGDGRNDELEVVLDLVNVLERRPLRLRLFDLSGRLLQEVEKEGVAGAQRLVWDGRDAKGVLVPPGTYILRIELQGDARSETVSRLIPVAY